MEHGLNNSYLYAAKKIKVTLFDSLNEKHIEGTCFFIKKDDILYLITNRHMVDPGYYDKKYKKYKIVKFEFQNLKINGTTITSVCDCNILNFNDFVFSDNYDDDVACLFKPESDGSDRNITHAIPFSMVADEGWIKEKLCVCDEIAYPGFPKFADVLNKTPIFRRGIISSDPRLNYSGDNLSSTGRIIAFEGFSSNGSSGSPVFSLQKGFQLGKGLSAPPDFYREVKLIGINAGHYDDSKLVTVKDTLELSGNISQHSGISYFIKSSAIHELIEKSSKETK